LPASVATTLNLTGVPAQTELSSSEMVAVGVSNGEISTLIELDTTEPGTIHVALLCKVHVTTSWLLKVEDSKIFWLFPTTKPFTLQINVGAVPGSMAVALKRTNSPEQTVLSLTVMVAFGTLGCKIVTLMELDTTTEGEAHTDELCNVQVTTSWFCKVEVEKLVSFVPTTVPLTFQVYTGLVP
jgi:hypothetical protein